MGALPDVDESKLLRLSNPMVKIPLVQLLPAFVWDQLGAQHMDTLLAATYMQMDVVCDLAYRRIFEVIKKMKPDNFLIGLVTMRTVVISQDVVAEATALAAPDPRLPPSVNHAFDLVLRARTLHQVEHAVSYLGEAERRQFLEGPFRGFPSVMEAFYMLNKTDASAGAFLIRIGAPFAQVSAVLRQAIVDGATEWIRTIVATHPHGAWMLHHTVMDDGLTPLAYARLHKKRHEALASCLLLLGAAPERAGEPEVRACGFARRAEHEAQAAASVKRLRV